MRNPAFLDALGALCFLTVALSLTFLGGCALQRYESAPLDPAASARAFDSRSTDTPGLKEYLIAHGHLSSDWPVQRWGLADLTLLAFYYHPDLDLARAQAKAAHAGASAATQRLPLGLTPRVQHHSLTTSEQSSPWSLGFELEIPIAGTARREATSERAAFLADAADLKVGSVAWAVRSEVRAKLLDCYAADRAASLLDVEIQQRRVLVGLLERRLEAGAASRVEANNARLAQVEAEGQAQAAQLVRERSLAALAQALALPLAAVRGMSLDFAAFEQTPAPPGDAGVQRAALLNRLDVRAKLLEYSAADTEVKLEVARQYPSLSISPGYLWDQGDNIWSLAATVLLPAGGNKPAIQVAEARREVAAREFLALQGRVLSEADSAEARYRQALAGAGSSHRLVRLQAARDQETKKQFDAGYADRLELTLAQLGTLAAQRNAVAVESEVQRALGALEDALQLPLAGGPVPGWTRNQASPADLAWIIHEDAPEDDEGHAR
jgi:cobalt-zinc-cadmium efflux system outer membrane protein